MNKKDKNCPIFAFIGLTLVMIRCSMSATFTQKLLHKFIGYVTGCISGNICISDFDCLCSARVYTLCFWSHRQNNCQVFSE